MFFLSISGVALGTLQPHSENLKELGDRAGEKRDSAGEWISL